MDQKNHRLSGGRSCRRTVVVAVCCIFIWNVLPVCAANIPAFYKVLESVSPGMADLFVPIEKDSSSQGVLMRVEAVHLDGKQAKVIASFQDEEGYFFVRSTFRVLAVKSGTRTTASAGMRRSMGSDVNIMSSVSSAPLRAWKIIGCTVFSMTQENW